MEPNKPRLRVVHWWPGRQYKFYCPIPSFLVSKAKDMGSRYLTYASYDNGSVSGWAFCCPKDTPSRRVGRDIATGRLRAMAEKLEVELPECH